MTERARYWDVVARAWQGGRRERIWRVHCDRIHAALLARWRPAGRVRRLLKTDVFDEACRDGLYPLLASRAERVVGVDLSITALHAARSHHSRLRVARADVRRLPFGDGTFDVVVSNSTLDHFDSFDDVVASLLELRRVLRAGGQLLLTLDNSANPVVALRNALPFRLLHGLGIVPYYVGPTCGPRRLRRTLSELGFDVGEVHAIMHCPRVLAVAAANLLDQHGGPAMRRALLRWLMASERLAGWPTRFLTGYFIAVRAVRRDRPA